MITPQMVGVVGLEPTRYEKHQLLMLTRLPISPHTDKFKTENTLSQKCFLWFAEPSLIGAERESRTPYAKLFRLALYQLSYFGIWRFIEDSNLCLSGDNRLSLPLNEWTSTPKFRSLGKQLYPKFETYIVQPRYLIRYFKHYGLVWIPFVNGRFLGFL